jgi:dTDP-4-amino-4,6-dideoxygalactose transaminase
MEPRTLGKIPLVDLGAQYRAHKDEFDAAIADCLSRTSFVGGPDHKALAEEFASWCGGGAVALVGNGTDALELALVEVLGEGDGTGEVITPSHTFIATAEAILNAGYRPVFVDIDPDTFLMDLDAVEAAIGPETKAIMPVHIYGQMVAMDRLAEIARACGVKLIEDAAQAHGARWKGDLPGTHSDAVCFSFYPGKNLGAWGDGGAVFSRDTELVDRITMRANHGRTDKYLHEFIGRNSRLDGVQAAVLRVKLRHIDAWNAARRSVARRYTERLAGRNGIKCPTVAGDAEHVFHLYVVEVEDRDRVRAALNEAGIGAGVHYPVPLHEQPALKNLGYAPSALPITQRAGRRILSLPIFPEMTEDQIDRVSEVLIETVGG